MEEHAGGSAVEAVQSLFIRNSDVLEAYILGLVPDFALSKDILHEVFLVVTRKAAEFRTGADFLAWVRGIARMKALEAMRGRKNAPRPLAPETLEALEREAPAAEARWSGHREALTSCIEQLAPRAREILKLRYAEQPSPPRKIAEKLSWTVGAVRVALARARKYLLGCAERKLSGQGVIHG